MVAFLEEQNLEDLQQIKFSDLFKIKGLLGQGAYGVVVSVSDRFRTIADTSALKIINKQRLYPEQIAVIRGESKILRQLVGAPNVV